MKTENPQISGNFQFEQDVNHLGCKRLPKHNSVYQDG